MGRLSPPNFKIHTLENTLRTGGKSVTVHRRNQEGISASAFRVDVDVVGIFGKLESGSLKVGGN